MRSGAFACLPFSDWTGGVWSGPLTEASVFRGMSARTLDEIKIRSAVITLLIMIFSVLMGYVDA